MILASGIVYNWSRRGRGILVLSRLISSVPISGLSRVLSRAGRDLGMTLRSESRSESR